jgi:cytochrome c oxidase subunit IV
MSETNIPKKTYYQAWGALLILLAATVGMAYLQLGAFNALAALCIAVTKATIIMLYFMHVRYSSHLVWIFVGAGFFWLGILIVLTMSDYLTRGLLPTPTDWLQ